MWGSDRGASSVVGVVLMIALVVVLAGTAVYYFGDMTNRLHEPSIARVSAEQTTIEDPDDIAESGQDGCAGLSGHKELAVDVTLTQLRQADVIYVLVSDEGGEHKKVLWESPTSDDVGETLRLANEQQGVDGVDVDIGGGSDWAYCPGEDATFRFYARYDGRTSLLQEYRF